MKKMFLESYFGTYFVSLGYKKSCKILTKDPNGILYFLPYECEMKNMFN